MLISTLQSMVCRTISPFCGTILRGFKGDLYALIIPLLLRQPGFAFEARHVHGELTPMVGVTVSSSAVP